MLLPQKNECKSFLIFLQIIFLYAVLVPGYAVRVLTLHDRGRVFTDSWASDEHGISDRLGQSSFLMDNPVRVQTSKSGFDSS
jgi:hypothetical protein